MTHSYPNRRSSDLDLFGVDPGIDDVGTDVRLVLVIGEDDLDRFAENLAAEVFDRHARRNDRSGAGEIGVGARLVVDRKSTRLNPVTNAHLVCRLLLEKKKHQE